MHDALERITNNSCFRESSAWPRFERHTAISQLARAQELHDSVQRTGETVPVDVSDTWALTPICRNLSQRRGFLTPGHTNIL